LKPWSCRHLSTGTEPICASRASSPASEGIIAGWAALSPVSQRQVYAGCGEVSVYVAAASRGAGSGGQLLEALIDESERQRHLDAASGNLSRTERASSLHLACGFREVAVASDRKMNGQWREPLFERAAPDGHRRVSGELDSLLAR
jgi:phosphinothricin acetyltransferase